MAGAKWLIVNRLGYGTVTMTVVLTDWLEVELTKPAAMSTGENQRRPVRLAL
jgi:hypothetical protein